MHTNIIYVHNDKQLIKLVHFSDLFMCKLQYTNCSFITKAANIIQCHRTLHILSAS